MDDEQTAYLKNMARDIQDIKSLMTRVINAISEAESEIPEKMRRFVMYFHDIHDIKHIYEELGHTVPPYVLREVERCDDRYRHLVDDLNEAGATFEKVRREMTKREGNKWDHSKLLPKEKPNETNQSNGSHESGA